MQYSHCQFTTPSDEKYSLNCPLIFFATTDGFFPCCSGCSWIKQLWSFSFLQLPGMNDWVFRVICITKSKRHINSFWLRSQWCSVKTAIASSLTCSGCNKIGDLYTLPPRVFPRISLPPANSVKKLNLNFQQLKLKLESFFLYYDLFDPEKTYAKR